MQIVQYLELWWRNLPIDLMRVTISLFVIYHELRGNLLLYAFMLMEYWMCDNMDGRMIIIK
jgi:hypothetical protein